MRTPRRLARTGVVSTLLTFGLMSGLLSGCGPGDNSAGSRATQVGKPDQAQAGSVSIDETALAGTVQSGRLLLRIPVKNTGAASSGDLTVSIVQVDGTKIFANVRAPYSVPAGTTSTLTADLPVPAGVVAQADWSAFNVLIEGDGTQGLRVTRSLLAVAGSYDVQLEGPATVTSNRMVSYRVRAQDPVAHTALPGVPVTLQVRSGANTVVSYDATTGPQGDAIFNLSLADAGDVTVAARGTLQGTTTEVEEMAKVQAPGSKVLLTTDKPLYQPGQIIHLRALALDRASQAPVSNQTVVFEIQDGKGNKIFKKSLTSDKYGLAATDFRLGQVLNMGTFQLRVLVGADKGEKTVTVSRYALPKFKVDVAADKPWYTPGQTVAGTVDARYFFGKAAAGADVVIEAATLDIGQTVFAKVMGKTDGNGRYAFSVMLPTALVGLPIQSGSGLVNLAVTVTDSAGQQVKQALPVTVAARGLRLALVPEATVLVPGMKNRIDVFVTDPLGNPVADATLQVTAAGGAALTGKTDAYGQAAFDWTPPPVDPGGAAGTGGAPTGAQVGVMVEATTKDGLMVTEPFMLDAQAGASHVLVRTDEAVYGLGDTVQVDITTSADRSAVYVDWLNNGQDVDMQTLDVKAGVAHFTKTVDAALVGSNRIEAYVVGTDGNIVRAGRTVFVRDRGALSVDLTADQAQYTPGAPAKLTFSVKDETGAPMVAAVGIQIVDQAVFALVDAQPGLLRTVFQLNDEFAQPTYQIRPPAVDLTKLLLDDTTQADKVAATAAQVRAAATLAALGPGGLVGIHKSSWQALTPAVKAKLLPFYQGEKTRLLATVNQATEAGIAALQLMSCKPTDYYCPALQKSFFQALQEQVATRLSIYDFWGNAYRTSTTNFNELVRLTTNGPDEKASTDDDDSIVFLGTDVKVSVDLSRTDNFTVPGAGNAGGPMNAAGPATGGTGTGSAGTSGGGGAAASSGSATDSGPRVRQDFPETLYVNPEVITGPDGKATVSLDLADSITDWRVSTLAHSLGGKVGGGIGTVRVFQDFFVDIDFPATLTRGDAVEFPVAVYNYLTVPQTVHLTLQAGTWYTATGSTNADVVLGPGQVTGIRFPVRVDTVGRQTLTVKATGGTRSDAVARSVLVEPDGKAIPRALSGSLAAGAVALSATFPPDAIPGSQKLYLNVFPAYLSQVVQGMDSLLRVPNGCFEQTTSTAWPNVLVTDYLKQTNQLKPDIQLKAEALMSAGYQRLLTFEHAGGGFSWFGEQDPKPFLSVTAFGLMEFGDMAKVQAVDPVMLQRTTQWLVAQQAADGSWSGDQSEFFSFQTSVVRNTAFVVWALASSGYQGPQLAKGLAYVKQNLGTGNTDTYTLGIAANAFLSAAPGDAFGSLLVDKIVAQAKTNGDKVSWDSAGIQTNFYGQGNDADVSASALCTQALLIAGGHKNTVDGALAFLTSSRDSNGNFGSTQATIWTLRALLLAAKTGTDGAVGNLTVDVDGASFMQVALTKDQSDVMTTVDMGTLATAGTHNIGLTFAGTGKVSYNLVAQHNLPWASMAPPPAGPLSVDVAYDKTTIALDASATATVTVRNNTQSAQDMILLTVGLPPGFQIATEDLDAYKTQKILSGYELTGKQLILYVSSLRPAAVQTFVYHLRATMPVKAADGGAEVMLYYQPEKRGIAKSTMVEVIASAMP
jgi:hypothetical protein